MTFIEIRRYVTAAGKDVFQGWLNTLRDATTRAKTELRIMRLERGLFGDCMAIAWRFARESMS